MKYNIFPSKKWILCEENLNSFTHAIGLILSIVGLIILLILTMQQNIIDKERLIAFSIYGVSLIILFLSSMLYHGIQNKTIKSFFQRIDHCSIFILISGTYTPFALITLHGYISWILLILVWSLALIGIIGKLFFYTQFKKISLSFYMLLGWIAIFFIQYLWQNLPLGGFIWLVAGGIVYSIGVIFYVWKHIPFNHLIWHIFVLGGSACHFFSILYYVLPR